MLKAWARKVLHLASELHRICISINPGVKIGRGTNVSLRAEVKTKHGGKITIGQRCYIDPWAQLRTLAGDITIGDDCTVNSFCTISGTGGVRIGNGVRIAPHCTIIGVDHVFDDRSRPIFEQGVRAEGITIEDDVWLGAGASVLGGVTVRAGCVIGAGAVVTRSTEPMGVYVGVPAKLLRYRGI